jgi:hypothetical protein
MVLRRLLTVGVSTFALLLGSCVTNSSSVYISGAVAADAEECIYDLSGERLVTSSVDPGTPTDVLVTFVVDSLILKRMFNVATDVSTVLITEAEVSLASSSGASVGGGAFIVDTPGGVVPGSTDGTTAGQGLVTVPVIPAAVLAGLAAPAAIGDPPFTYVATITLRGRTNGDIDIEAGPFQWTVQLLAPNTLTAVCGADTKTCCGAGQNGEARCTDQVGLCLATQ